MTFSYDVDHLFLEFKKTVENSIMYSFLVPQMSTPAKEEKRIQPKNLMSSKFGTPQKTG